MDLRPIALAAALALAAVRVLELWIDRRHVRQLREVGAHYHGRAGLEAIVAAQTVFLAGLLVEGVFVPPHPQTNASTLPLLALAIAGFMVRYWCIVTLRERWTIAVYTLPGRPPVRTGPYRFLRHPNYAAVLLEFAALTLALQCWVTFAAAGAILVPALAYRIHAENRAIRPADTKTGARQTS